MGLLDKLAGIVVSTGNQASQAKSDQEMQAVKQNAQQAAQQAVKDSKGESGGQSSDASKAQQGVGGKVAADLAAARKALDNGNKRASQTQRNIGVAAQPKQAPAVLTSFMDKLSQTNQQITDDRKAKLQEAIEERDAAKDAKEPEEAPWDYSDALTAFMNSDNPYAQAYLRDNGIDPGNFDWYKDYGSFAANGGKDVWAAMVTSDDNMKRAYLDDYGKDIDFDSDSDISVDEAARWWQNMKDANQVKSLDFADTDNEVMRRIFGGTDGGGMDNDLVDALNMMQTMRLVSGLASGSSIDELMRDGTIKMPYASDTNDAFASTIGLLEDMGAEDFDLNGEEFNDKVARLNNALKLDRLISAADENRASGDNRTVIDFGDDPRAYANQIGSLLNNVAGGDSGLRLSDKGLAVDADDKVYDRPATGSPDSDAVKLANAVINSGGREVPDDLAYLLTNYLGAGDKGSLGDQGYKAYRSDGRYYNLETGDKSDKQTVDRQAQYGRFLPRQESAFRAAGLK